MATAIESPGIVSAKEEAAAILFARDTQAPVMSAPAPEKVVTPTREKSPQPIFAHYHEPETVVTHKKAVDMSELRPYPNFDETAVAEDTKVLRTYIDSSEYLTSPVETTTMTVEAPTATVAEAPKTTTVVRSALDMPLEEDTQYVLKFKKSTIVAASIVASIIMLMAVLLVVNIVSLVTVSAEVSALTQESVALEQSLSAGQSNLEQARAAVNAHSGTSHQAQYVAKAESTYVEPNSEIENSSFFDWMCHALSRLFD